MPYTIIDRAFYREDNNGVTPLTNFIAEISEETHYTDGLTVQTMLTLRGSQNAPRDTPDDEPVVTYFPEITITAESFAGMQWVLPKWGVRAIISPGQGVRDDLRVAIQTISTPKRTTVYKHTGWTIIDKKNAYLHAGGAIFADGNHEEVRVSLPSEMGNYDLDLHAATETRTAILRTLELAELGPPAVASTLFAATFAPLFGPVDFSVHLSGRTGTFKSELMSLWQAHYGPNFNGRTLPGSWTSTGNALEAQAFIAKDAVFVIDDYVPHGTNYQQRAYQASADKMIRGQGNQAGRSRLTDSSTLQTTFWPRGIILSTGEDTPDGHSCRARMMILELAPGDITTTHLTKAQLHRPDYHMTTSALIAALAELRPNITPEVDAIRQKMPDLGHARTPAMLARLIHTVRLFTQWATAYGAISKHQSFKIQAHHERGLRDAAAQQLQYLTTADPADIFVTALRTVLAAHLAHVRTLSGGVPKMPERLGWTEESSTNEMPTYKSHGPTIGWISWDTDELFIEVNVGISAIKKVAAGELALTRITLMKRLKEAGALKRVDDGRSRNSIRITAQKHTQNVLAMSASAVLETEEKP